MTDRELLELAAKAAGYDVEPAFDGGSDFLNTTLNTWWNPLDIDGDAFRLAVKLRIDVDHVLLENGSSYVLVEQKSYTKTSESIRCIEKDFNEQDRLEITRRAIVQVAAEIGKRMLKDD